MFTIFTLESLKFWKFGAKNITRIFAGIVALLFLLLYFFPLGDASYILRINELLRDNVNVNFYDVKKLAGFLSFTPANYLHLFSYLAGWLCFCLLLILFVYLQITFSRREDVKSAFYNFIAKLPLLTAMIVLWAVFFMISAPLFFVPFPILFATTLLAPYFVLLKNSKFWQAFHESNIVVYGFKLFSIFVILTLYLILNSVFNVAFLLLFNKFVYLKVLLIIVKQVLLFLFMARAFYLMYFYLVEFSPPFYRVLGIANPHKMLDKLNAGEYPLMDEEAKQHLTVLALQKRRESGYDLTVFNKFFNPSGKDTLSDTNAAGNGVEFGSFVGGNVAVSEPDIGKNAVAAAKHDKHATENAATAAKPDTADNAVDPDTTDNSASAVECRLTKSNSTGNEAELHSVEHDGRDVANEHRHEAKSEITGEQTTNITGEKSELDITSAGDNLSNDNYKEKYQLFLANRERIRAKLRAYLAERGQVVLEACELGAVKEIERRFYPPAGMRPRAELADVIAEVASELQFKRQTKKTEEE